ncbi:hypothetical protein [Vibrio maerlii]|uniref:hypothetical protein n=1 Tax=Vibrio maerlii TaxID=2231648 RepID=UPI000E3E3ED0|nr:hypothetical protein [Vibrio maerlii]
MKAIISLFIAMYKPSSGSVECQSYATPFCSDGLNGAVGDSLWHRVDYSDLCWAFSRARKASPVGYCVLYLRYVNAHPGYAKTVSDFCRQVRDRNSLPADQLRKRLYTELQQQEETFCQALKQQLTELGVH